jgi:hypothetical protein
MQVNIRMTCAGERVEMVLGFDYATVGFAAAAPLVNNVLDTSLWAVIRQQMCNRIVHDETYMIDLFSQFGGAATFGPFTDPAGTIVGKGVPNNSAFVVSHATDLRGKSYRGRSYVPGIAASLVDGNSLDPIAAAALVSGFNSMRVALDSDGINFAVLSRRANKQWRETGQATPVRISQAKDNTMDSQRGRLPGH